ncbi:hypothetical protein U1Q18_038133 [Sarracenia purpurea var. burkii]
MVVAFSGKRGGGEKKWRTSKSPNNRTLLQGMGQHILHPATPQRHRHPTKATLHHRRRRRQQLILIRHPRRQDIKVTSVKDTLLNLSLTSTTIVSITNTKIRRLVPHSSKGGMQSMSLFFLVSRF